jgi:DNA topoisomerase-1
VSRIPPLKGASSPAPGEVPRSGGREPALARRRLQAIRTDQGAISRDPPLTTAASVESANEAGLHYVSDVFMPGIRRRKEGDHFVYIDPDGGRIEDEATLARIRKLAIPPAWTGVWISPLPNGHLQATGRDAKGRKQYRYHERWREVRDGNKYGRLIEFAHALPKIRARVRRDLKRPGLPREKVLATVVRLLETTMIRVGNEEYERQNQSFGLTTLHHDQADVEGDGTLRFYFRGKSGKEHNVEISDRRLAQIVKECEELPGQELFQYVDDSGKRHHVHSHDVNADLRETTGQHFTAKDFRTWAGTVLAARALWDRPEFASLAQARKNIVAAIDSVARQLGNTRTVARNSYVHPAIFDTYLDGTLSDVVRGGQPIGAARKGLRADEAAVLNLLEQRPLDCPM